METVELEKPPIGGWNAYCVWARERLAHGARVSAPDCRQAEENSAHKDENVSGHH